MKTIFCSLALVSFLFISCKNGIGLKAYNQSVEVSVFNDLISYQYLYKSSDVNNGLSVETYEIKYLVDGLMITGYIHKPKSDLEAYPGKIYYHGNNKSKGNFGRNHLEEQRNLAGKGYVVLSSQLRGNIFSQEKEETMGSEVNDILALVKIAKCLSFVNSQNIKIHDVSRVHRSKNQYELIHDEISSKGKNCSVGFENKRHQNKVKIEVFHELIAYQYLNKSGVVNSGSSVETYEIKYQVDGLMITGYINKPIGDQDVYPAIIYCRGGNRDFGTFGRRQLEQQRNLAGQGFVVLSSQLRGNIFSQGTDEMGGADLDDILQLIKIAKNLSFVNEQRIGIHGVSRGGRNAYQISRISDEVIAVSVIGSPVDIRDSHSYRPKKYTKVNLPLIGDTINFKNEYDKRSPILWVDELNEPLLILHGVDDWRCKVENVKRIIPELEKYNKEFEYHFIEGGSHTLGTHAHLRDSLVVQWHKKHLE